jgi:ribose 5-phosphate isomerase B
MSKNDRYLAIGCDHAGYPLKEFLKKRLIDDNYEIEDFGTNSEESVDYPDIIHPLANAVNDGMIRRGIIICGSGNGASMVANKYPNIRAALCWSVKQAELARLHNNANIIALPGRFIEFDTAYEIIRTFLSISFEGGRHQRRVDKIAYS